MEPHNKKNKSNTPFMSFMTAENDGQLDLLV